MVDVTSFADSSLGPGGIPITELSLRNASLPADLTLSLEKSDWQEWRRHMENRSSMLRFNFWLNGSLECPDQSLYPNAHRVWKKDDHTFREFFLKHISVNDYQQLYRLEVFEELRKRHELLRIYAQAALFKRAFNIRLRYDMPLSETVLEIELINERIVKMGTLTQTGYLRFYCQQGA